jgi:hypothetical protein
VVWRHHGAGSRRNSSSATVVPEIWGRAVDFKRSLSERLRAVAQTTPED